MNHQEIKEALFLFYDGELSGPERREVSAHLDVCGECRADLNRWTSAVQAFFPKIDKPLAAETERFVARVMKRLAPVEEPEPLLPRFGLRWAVPALGFGLALLIVSLISSRPESLVSTDELMLMDARSRGVQEIVLPPDPARADDMMSLVAENQ